MLPQRTLYTQRTNAGTTLERTSGAADCQSFREGRQEAALVTRRVSARRVRLMGPLRRGWVPSSRSSRSIPDCGGHPGVTGGVRDRKGRGKSTSASGRRCGGFNPRGRDPRTGATRHEPFARAASSSDEGGLPPERRVRVLEGCAQQSNQLQKSMSGMWPVRLR